MKYLVSGIEFKPSHKYPRNVITLSARFGSMSSTLICFEPCMNADTFDENKELFRILLYQILEDPESFLSHWIEKNTLAQIKEWIYGLNINCFQFRILENESGFSGAWHNFYLDHDESLKTKFDNFKIFFNKK